MKQNPLKHRCQQKYFAKLALWVKALPDIMWGSLSGRTTLFLGKINEKKNIQLVLEQAR